MLNVYHQVCLVCNIFSEYFQFLYCLYYIHRKEIKHPPPPPRAETPIISRALNYNDLLSNVTTQQLVKPKELERLRAHFWERWKKEYTLTDREY